MRAALLLLTGLLLTALLTGCGGSAGVGPGAVAQAAPAAFAESETVDQIPVQLLVEPFQPGRNQFTVVTKEEGIEAVETQVIMMEMGHGGIIDLEPTEPGQYTASSALINMDGKWMLRVKLTTTAGEEKLVTLYGRVKSTE